MDERREGRRRASRDATPDEPGDEYSEWFRSTGDPQPGFISGNRFDLKPVQYSAINGMAIVEGDIVVGTVEEMERLAGAERDVDTLPVSGVVITGERFRWPGGLIPWQSEAGLRQRVLDAIRHWEANTDIRFVERTTTNAANFPNFLSFQALDGCWSQVGMRGGEQVVSLAAGCGFGAAVHEIGHAVGVWHEQSREDRAQFVRVVWENIEPGREHNFNQHITDGDDVGTYDYGSIMHYGATAFSRNGQPTIVPLVGTPPIGQRNGLSVGDIAAVRAIYPNLQPSRSWAGVQFRGPVGAGATRRWFTHSWPSYWYVVWTVVPTGPVQDRAAQIEWKVQVERQTETLLKYYVEIRNLTTSTVDIEARYNVLGWSRDAR